MAIFKKRQEQPDGLIKVLLDENAEPGDRDDAAMDLSAYDDPEVESALLSVAQKIREDEDLLDSCGESLAEIWSRQNNFSINKLRSLNSVALRVAVDTLAALRPEWRKMIEEKKKEKD